MTTDITLLLEPVQFIENIVETPEIHSVQGAKASRSFGTAPVRHVNFAEIVEVVEVEPLLPDESLPVFMTAAVVDVPPVMVEDVQPAPMAESVQRWSRTLLQRPLWRCLL